MVKKKISFMFVLFFLWLGFLNLAMAKDYNYTYACTNKECRQSPYLGRYPVDSGSHTIITVQCVGEDYPNIAEGVLVPDGAVWCTINTQTTYEVFNCVNKSSEQAYAILVWVTCQAED
jgi:hypothetical protein